MSPLGEEHLPCPHRGQSQPFAHTVLWENHYSYVHLICSVFSESQLWPVSVRVLAGRGGKHTAWARGLGLAS